MQQVGTSYKNLFCELIMEFIQEYGKEIFSLSIPIIVLIVGNLLRAKAKLQLGVPHIFTFIVDEPRFDNEGNQISPNQTVHTISHLIVNAGKDSATNIEIMFNWKPQYVNIWPPRHYEETTENDGRYILLFNNLAPGEQIKCELLSINAELPPLINARCKECVAKEVTLVSQLLITNPLLSFVAYLLLAGIAFTVYIIILLLEFLLAGTTP